MAFMSLEKNFFEKKLNLYLILQLLKIFVFLLPSFLKERSHKTLSVLAKSANKHILMAIVWLYGFESVFCQVEIDFFLLSICFSFCNRIKNEYRQFLFPSSKTLLIVHLWEFLVDFEWFSLL